MNQTKAEIKKELKHQRRQEKRRKKNALVVCSDGKEFWTTQNQFWQWVRERVVVKAGDHPLTGRFLRPDVEKEVVICNMVLNLAHPNHLQEVVRSRRFKSN